jgi:rRNA maturation RNase YbeY
MTIKMAKLHLETTIDFQIQNANIIQYLVDFVLAEQGCRDNAEITVVFMDHSDTVEMNRQFFSKNSTTDVISFNLEEQGDPIEGEIYVNVEQAREQAQHFGVTVETEIYRLIAHGLYHLVGYSDDSDSQRQEMTQHENKALEALNTYCNDND